MSKVKNVQNAQTEKVAPVQEATATTEVATTQETVSTPAPVSAPTEPTSPKLEELRAKEKSEKLRGAQLLIAGNEKEAEEAFMESYKAAEAAKKELAEIKKHQAELAKKEKEAAVVALFDTAIEAYDKHLSVAASNASLDDKNAAYHDYQAKREIVVNRLLGSRPATATASKEHGSPKGATGSKIHDLILEKLGEGKSITEAKKEIKEMGYARGTVDTCATDMKKAGEIDY